MRPSMRLWLWLCAIVLGAATLSGNAKAQNYPWCALYGGGDKGGATNCGFVTFEQCLTTLSGMGGFCQQNTQYVAPARPRRPLAHQSRRHAGHH